MFEFQNNDVGQVTISVCISKLHANKIIRFHSIIIFALVIHSQGIKISKSKNVCPDWLGLGNCERVDKAHCVEMLNCH